MIKMLLKGDFYLQKNIRKIQDILLFTGILINFYFENLFVFRTPAKLISYKGWLVKKISKTGLLNKKNDSMTLLLVNEAKKDGKIVLEKDLLKLMFISVKDCEEFKKKCEELIE